MKEKPPKSLERSRLREGDYGSDSSFGMTGAFKLNLSAGSRRTFGRKVFAISSCPRDNVGNEHRLAGAEQAAGWEHVSVSLASESGTPTWAEMAAVKKIFWREDETVMQLHVPAADHVDDHPGVLHLWRPTEQEIPRPPNLLV